MATNIGICVGLPPQEEAGLRAFLCEEVGEVRLGIVRDLSDPLLENLAQTVGDRVSLVVLHRDSVLNPVPEELPALLAGLSGRFPGASIVIASHTPFTVQRELCVGFPFDVPRELRGILPYASCRSVGDMCDFALDFKIVAPS